MQDGALPDGTVLKHGDIIHYTIGPHTGITRVVFSDGKLRMLKNFMYGDGYPIDNFIGQASYNCITKMSLTDLYKFCKKNKWPTGEYISKFSKPI